MSKASKSCGYSGQMHIMNRKTAPSNSSRLTRLIAVATSRNQTANKHTQQAARAVDVKKDVNSSLNLRKL